MGSADAIKKVIGIVKKPGGDARIAAVIVSALSGVTDELIKIANLAAAKDLSYQKVLAELERRHMEVVPKLISRKNQKRSLGHVKALFGYLESVVLGVSLVRELSPGALDYVMSYGERLSAHMLVDALQDRGVACEYVNAREMIITDDTFGEAVVDFVATNKRLQKYFKKHTKLQIVTGYIGATPDKKTTTLGRGGSDYSASIIGAALKAKVIEIWTDVSGVMTADPRKVKDALPIGSMTYSEAAEMSYFGAKVIHPPTMRPAQEKNIPILIKNTFEPSAPGTVIGKTATQNGGSAKGISSISNVTMLQVEGSGMSRIRGAAGRLFASLARGRINVILITQNSSQSSISFAIAPRDAARSVAAINGEFALERSEHLVDDVIIRRDLSILAVVGEGMRHRHGVAGHLFSTLGKNGVNVVAAAQGSSELNISVVIEKSDELRALNAVHTSFFFPEMKPVNIFLVGTGLIGSTLLKQITRQHEVLRRENGFAIRVVGIADAKHMSMNESGVSLENWRAVLTASKRPVNIKKFIEAMKDTDLSGKVFVDCTASDEVAGTYAEILDAGISVVTPNKRANSGSFAYYQQLKKLAKQPGVSFLYETNAAAALPVISMLDDLVVSGDTDVKIEAVLSGTLSYVFNTFTGKKLFSETIAEAKQLGFTEPDPREDLKGTDVARKILILARETGLPLEFKDVKVESLLSEPARRTKSVRKFFEQLKKEDGVWEKKKRAAEKSGKRLRYIATLEKGKATVALRAVPAPHPFYDLSGSDNVVSFTTERYSKTPLVIKGPGAGAEVTAAGVFADILRTARDMA